MALATDKKTLPPLGERLLQEHARPNETYSKKTFSMGPVCERSFFLYCSSSSVDHARFREKSVKENSSASKTGGACGRWEFFER